MAYQPAPVEQFGGLNLIDDPSEVGWKGAVDMNDVDLDTPGRVRTRDLFQALVANTTLTSPSVVGWGSSFIVSTNAALKLYSGGGILTGTAVAPAQYLNGTTQAFGTPSASYLYMADPFNVAAIRRLTTAAVISAPAGMPTASYLARTPTDNRLVAANISGFPSRVQFSNAGDAETWGVNNFVDLDPGDNEPIQGAVAWRDLLFVFKQSKFYVFYGTSTDSTGNPIFQYRAVRAAIGAAFTPVATPDGVYFFGWGPYGNSVYRTTGEEPQEIGREIRLIFSSPPSTFIPGRLPGVLDMAYANGRLHLLISNSTAGPDASTLAYLLSYHLQLGYWTLTQLPNGTFSISGAGTGATTFPVITTFGANSGVHNPYVGAVDSLRTPVPRYRSGFSELGTPDIKTIREWRLEGTGSPTFQASNDFGSLETGSAVALGTSPAIAENRYRKARRGRYFSWQLSGSAPWNVNNIVADVREKRAPSVHAAA